MAGVTFTKNDFVKFLDDLSNHVDLKLGSFIVPIVMYCVSFPYIINNSASEYIAWILIFFLNATFPFTYLGELFSLGRKTNKFGLSGYFVIYSITAIVISYILQFVVLLFVVLKNENIRKGKEKKGDYENEGKQDLDTKDWTVEFRDKNISILFIMGSVFVWAMVINHFSSDLQLNLFNPNKKDADSNLISQEAQMEDKFPIGSRIKWFVHLISEMFTAMDESWHDVIDNIPIGPLAKSSLVYCVSFITIIFSLFIRFTYARRNIKTMGPDGYASESVRIVQRKGHTVANIGALFGKTFQNHIHNIRKVAIVSIIFFIIIIGGMLGYVVKKLIYDAKTVLNDLANMTPVVGNDFTRNLITKDNAILPDWFKFEHGFVGWAVVCCVVLFPAFFAEKKHGPRNKIKDKIFPLHDSVYFKRDVGSNFKGLLNSQINVHYSPDELFAGELKLKPVSSPREIKTVIAQLGYYFKTFLFKNDTINNFGTTNDEGHVDINGTFVNLQTSFQLMEKKYKNINGFDVSVPRAKAKDYERFKTEFKSIMEQIYMQNYGSFESDRSEYAEANPGMDFPFVFEETAEYKEKKKLYETDSFNMPLKTYIFFLICLLFGFLCTLIIMTATSLLGGVSNKYFYVVFSLVMMISTVIVFGIGMGKKFLSPENDKDLKTFLAVMFTMAGASFFALSTRFNMLSYLWNTSGTCLSLFLKTVAPIAIVLFSSLSISFSFKNYKRFKYHTSE